MRVVEVDVGNGKVAKVTRPDRFDFDDNLGGGIAYQLANFLSWILETSGNSLGSFLGGGLVGFLETIEPHLVEYYSPVIDELLKIEDLPPFLKTFLTNVQSAEHEVAGAIGQAVLGSAAGGVTGSLLGVLLANATYSLNRRIEPARPVLPDAVTMKWRSALSDKTFDDWIHDQGWSPQMQSEYESVLRPRPPLADLIAWAWRVHQDPEKAREELKYRGWLKEDIDKYMELAKRLPGPGDLVSFAVREVWQDEARGEQLAAYPPQTYFDLMEKQGYDKERAEDYWAAHWRLPSANQGFEMFWRLEDFTEGELKKLLVRLDILPAYQDNLIKIAYHPITRVDIRRMNATGQITDADLPRYYQDIGFSPESAQMMADFTIAYNAGVETDYTKTEILKAFNIGMLEWSEAAGLLVDIGKSQDYAEFVLTLEVYKREMELLDIAIAAIQNLYIQWEIDETTARGRLMGLNLKATHVELLIEKWGASRRAKIALPTKTDLRDMFLQGVIDLGNLKLELKKRGYQDHAIEWYYTWWTGVSVEKAAKAAAEAQAEEERIAKAEFKTKRQVAIAHLNSQIAALNLAIAEFKQAIFDMAGSEQYNIIKLQIEKLWRDYWEAKTPEERAAIEAAIDALTEQVGLLDADIVKVNGQIVSAQVSIKALQLQKTELPIIPEEGG